jgi:hypothetical protein
MMSRLACVLIGFLGALALLGGCATPYQKKSFWTGPGYEDEKLAEGVYRVTSLVNQITSPEDAVKYWHRRAQELCGSPTYEESLKQGMRGPHNFYFVQGVARCQGATASIATIRDGGRSESSSKALLFYVTEVNGKRVENSLSVTEQENYGLGMYVTPVLLERQVLAEGEVLLKLRGQVHFGAPILAIVNMGKNYDATEVIRLQPKANAVYVVNGELTEAKSAVWLEDDATGERVGTPEPKPQAAK